MLRRQNDAMHLKSISIKGFKSFPDRTRLSFSPGVSVIVGPNGCGKSNITDAVLWALGEQSPIAVRGQSMRDVIFAGGKGQAPRGAAEVEVVIDNGGGEGFAELAIRRRLDRGGDGEYRLNGARCRLADVVETLADANLGREMHSVISQGRVEEIVHSRPRDRRLLIEEAAGLGKHRKRRRRAQLKLERTQANLDRALDVEREARARLRPLRRQAKAAETHARLERESLELRARLLGDRLRTHAEDLRGAEEAVQRAREARQAVEERLAEANRERTAIEERLAERDRRRTEVWGRLTALRAAHERLAVRAESIAARATELRAAIADRRAVLGSIAEEARAAGGGGELEGHREAIRAGLGVATEAFAALEGTDGDELAQGLPKVREGAERAARGARGAEELLGRRRQDSLEARLERETEVLGAAERLGERLAAARDAVGARVSALEEGVVAEGGDDEDPAAELRARSAREAELQGELRAAGDQLTAAEVEATQLRDRRDELTGELERIGARLERELAPADEPLDPEERAAIEAKLERLARRREQLGPINPLAEREYEEAKAHVDDLEAQRVDLEGAMSELQKLIGDTDAKISAAFERTFEATRSNFEELVEHLFPGGRGRLRLVEGPRPRPVLGGGEQNGGEADGGEAAAPGSSADAEEGSAEAGSAGAAGDEAEETEREQSRGVEIEVTPAGKATRRLSLLSGGEKSLVALAFVFAVFLARPSPFYILDEVEAALDDANIDRFLQLVRRFSDRAQFVIVTHQKRTMDAADVLYGVSMGEGGATRVVSRRFPRDRADDELGAAAGEGPSSADGAASSAEAAA